MVKNVNELQQRIRLTKKYSNIDDWYGVWNSVTDANNNIPLDLRSPGLTVGILISTDTVEEYWYNGGIEDNNLVIKAPSAIVERNINTNIDVGNSNANTIIPEGMTFTDYLELVHTKIFTPTFINPTFSLSLSGSNLRIIGSSTNFNLTVNFNRGSIRGNLDQNNIWQSNLIQNPRAGQANNYLIEGVNSSSNTRNITETVTQGINNFVANVSYDEGPQPKNSIGENFETPFPLGTSPNISNSFEGVYPIYASISDITVSSQLPLYSMQNANNIQVNLVAENGNNKQFFEIPNAWLNNRSLNSIQYFNTVSESFDSTNQISNFSTTSTTKTIEGEIINYTKYSHTGANRGNILIRLIF